MESIVIEDYRGGQPTEGSFWAEPIRNLRPRENRVTSQQTAARVLANLVIILEKFDMTMPAVPAKKNRRSFQGFEQVDFWGNHWSDQGQIILPRHNDTLASNT